MPGVGYWEPMAFRRSDDRTRDSMTTFRNSVVGRGLAAAIILMLVVLAAVPAVTAQSDDQVVWDTYNVDFTIREDGTVHVVETQVVEFNGRFTQGFADIPLTGVEEISNISVSIANGTEAEPQPATRVRDFDGEPGTFAYARSGGQLQLDYGFLPTSRGGSPADSMRTVVLEYDLIGALRVYTGLEPANQQLRWIAIASDVTNVAPIRHATVTVTLPETVDPAQTVARPEGVETDGQIFTWTRSNLRGGDQFEVNLQFPPITAATKPSWQDRFDQARQAQQQQEEQSAVAGTLFLGAGLLLLVGGPLLLAGIWYTRGRDPEVGLVADVIPEPPDDLRPGAAGTLLDEVTDYRDVVATVFDLARRGIIRLDEKQTQGFMGFGRQTRYSITLLERPEHLTRYEQTLLDAMFGPNAEVKTSVPMEQVQASFGMREQTIHNGFYDELVAHGYFGASPEKTRQRYQFLRFVGPALAALVIILVIVFTGANSGFIVLPIIAAIVLYILGGKVAENMPRKTMKGAEAAAKWEAFRRYLQEIEQHENLEEAQGIFERFLPYAIAFELDNSWIQKFAQTSAPMPAWFGPTVFGGPGRYNRPFRPYRPGGVWVVPTGGGSAGRRGRDDDRGPGGGGGGGTPDLQDMSDRAAGGLQGGSDSIFDMLGTAADIFGGKGGSRGGGSFGGWSGGGGSWGGFSGGGGFGGGGGGGSRGFK